MAEDVPRRSGRGVPYALGANSYLVKPVECEQLLDLVRSFDDYWRTWNATLEPFEQ